MPIRKLSHTGYELDLAVALNRGDAVDNVEDGVAVLEWNSPPNMNDGPYPKRVKCFSTHVIPLVRKSYVTEYDISECTTLTYMGVYDFPCLKYLGTEHNILPNITNYFGSGNHFTSCPLLEEVHFPNLTNLWASSFFNRSNTGLREVSFGSVGKTCSRVSNSIFYNVANSDLAITVFTNGQYVDETVTNLRSGAPNSIIVIKASESTTYNGISYSAGKTILTSVVGGDA